MKRFEAQEAWLPSALLPRYAAAVRRFKSREERFSSQVLLRFSAAAAEGFEVRAGVEGEPTEILLYDEIGYWGVTAKDFVLALASIGPGPIRLRINSPGGDTFDGLAIYNALKARIAPVTVVIDGIAASAASFIAMAGKTVEMPEQAMLMVHNCWGLCIGNRHDMITFASVQEKIDGQMAQIYAKKCGKPATDMAAAMDAETYYTSTEAKVVGLCDAILLPADAAAAASALLTLRSHGAQPVRASLRADALPAYDPDGDGDNDAAEALGLIGAAMTLLDNASRALTGNEDDDDAESGDDAGSSVVVPGARARRAPRSAATTPEWMCSAAEDLPVDDKTSWDGPAATERMLDAAGFNGDSPDPAKAKGGFLAWDHHNPKLKGNYKLPFADLVDGKLTALKSGIDAAASRLPDTEIPDPVKTKARAVLDGYEKKMKPADSEAKKRARLNRLRLAAADAA